MVEFDDDDFQCQLGRCYDMGEFGKDSPYSLIDKVVKHAGELHKTEQFEAVLLLGDFP